MTTRAPCAASASTIALPMPLLPPVTIATFPCKRMAVLLSVAERLQGACQSCGASWSRRRPNRATATLTAGRDGGPGTRRGWLMRRIVLIGLLLIAAGAAAFWWWETHRERGPEELVLY